MTNPYVRLDKNNAAVLMVDHQTGLLSLVRDIDPDKFKNNVLALADLAAYFKLPTILTTSFEDGPNGPLVPELKEKFPDAPFIPRPAFHLGVLECFLSGGFRYAEACLVIENGSEAENAGSVRYRSAPSWDNDLT